ncbi:hypothetical protein SSP24_40840 [Streptomyces spinoverrucosus]|uniref:HTH merR-type domain-containing protein n=1 Tax=Streptomyces spinoverrucosus TaxID=284043 RepID=A0A4Y3VLC5_9ACTN|nr:hypothetical protein SSP24_40840 [Streptomyces spinoverrucosus]GHB87213.1 hypothetical protein GCM10010397_68730 [Streptomyces spinoverrucosus]
MRFYADSGLLRPAEVDPVSGYRYYCAGQVARATALRRLRAMGMPLTVVAAVLDAGPAEASRLIDEHVGTVLADAVAAQRRAAVVKSSLADVPSVLIAAVKGPVLADAVEQILTATAPREPEMPVLGGLRMEAAQEAITLTATDRYRLSTRTLVPAEPPTKTWAATVDGDELRAAAAGIRRSALVRIEATPHGIRLRMADGEDQYCRSLSEPFPDYRLMLASLGEVTTRVTVPKDQLLRALEEHPGERLALHVTDHGVQAVSADVEHPGMTLPAIATGRTVRVWFDLTTLYPAVSTAIGPDVMLEVRGPDQPVTVRSADRGDLTTLAMPVNPDDGKEANPR